MMKTELTERALAFATHKHKKHVRKYTNEPYVNHLVNVANTVADHGGDEEMVAAALLRDTLEDTATTPVELLVAFGPRVAMLVEALTDTPVGHGNRATRKALDRKRLADADAAVHTIKLADLLDNTATIMEHDPGFGKVYMNEKRMLLEVLTKGHPDLMAKAKTSVARHTAAA